MLLKWFHAEGERHVDAAHSLRARYEAGELRVLAPPLLWLEIVNVAARRWGWTRGQLQKLVGALTSLGFEIVEPDLGAVARWAARGLTAYDAAYVAVAEQTSAPLVTDDEEVARLAPRLTTPLRRPDTPRP